MPQETLRTRVGGEEAEEGGREIKLYETISTTTITTTNTVTTTTANTTPLIPHEIKMVGSLEKRGWGGRLRTNMRERKDTKKTGGEGRGVNLWGRKRSANRAGTYLGM